MKANELMIGDWVKINYRGKFVKVTAIHDGLIDTTAISPLMEDEYEPIPLTAEILEKNGWTKRSSRNDEEGEMEKYQYNGLGWCYCFSNGDYEFEIIGFGSANPRGGGGFRGVLKYVHELQHALRLCGIEKEIEL